MNLPVPLTSCKALISLLSAAFFMTLIGCDNDKPETKEALIRPVKMITVGDLTAGTQRVYPAEVEAGNRSEQAFRVGGKLVKLPAKAGSKVKQGELLAQLDPSDFQLRMNEQQARFDLAQVQYERTETLVKQALIPRSDFDKAKSNMLSARADLQLAKANLTYTELRAPFDGMVSKVNVKNHQNVRQNAVVLVIQTTDNIEISFYISENIISKIEKGKGRSIHPIIVFDAVPDKTYEASIKEFDSEADPQTRSYKVTLIMPSPEEFTALPGMSANVHLDLSRIVDTSKVKLVVPVEAVFSPEDKSLSSKTYMVWKVSNDTMETQRTQVTISQINNQGIEITSGLQPGDLIITAGVNFIKEGQKVRPWTKESGL